MRAVQALVPSRFLLLIAHLVIVITMFWSVDDNIRACLPVSYTTDQFNSMRTELMVALAITLFLFLIEILGFVSGFSMFNGTQTLLSIGAHAGASVALSFFLFDALYCRLYWYIFAFCSLLPALTEVCIILGVVCFKRGF